MQNLEFMRTLHLRFFAKKQYQHVLYKGNNPLRMPKSNNRVGTNHFKTKFMRKFFLMALMGPLTINLSFAGLADERQVNAGDVVISVVDDSQASISADNQAQAPESTNEGP